MSSVFHMHFSVCPSLSCTRESALSQFFITL